MKTGEIILDFKNNSWILGSYMQLRSTTCGHYSFPMINMYLEFERPVNIVLHCEDLKMFESGEKKEMLRNNIGNLIMHQNRN